MLQVLDGAALRAWVVAGRDALAAARDELDALNVYPVADRDTGTNLLVTLTAAHDALRAAPDDDAAGELLCRAALLGAHGNSGALLSQLLRGLVEGLGSGDGQGLAQGLARAADLAYAAVAQPVEGTLLTVARSAADAAAGAGPVLGDVVSAALVGAEQALARTPDLLPALREAGVVDAGGRGLVLLLRALEDVVLDRCPAQAVAPIVERDPSVAVVEREAGSDAFAYEVQYLLHGATDAGVARLRERLARLGDSLVVVGGGGLHNVHVHVNDVGAALEAGLETARPSRVTVTRFAEQRARPPARSVVAVVPGDGLRDVFERAGAHVVPAEPPPTAADLLAAARATGSREVVLLAHDAVTRDTAAGAVAASADGPGLAVVSTASAVGALAALAVAEPGLGLPEDAAGMTAAAAGTRSASVALAVQAADTSAGPCVPGDALGLVGSTVVLVGADPAWVAKGLVDRLSEGAELLTVVLGRQAPEGTEQALSDHVARHHPHLELTLVQGGQARPAVLIGVE